MYDLLNGIRKQAWRDALDAMEKISGAQAQELYKAAALCTKIKDLPDVGDRVLSIDMEDPKTLGDHIFSILFDSGRKAYGHYWDEETRLKNTGGSNEEMSSKEAQLLYKAASVEKLKKKHGITKMEDGVGFSPTEKKWWGWSHRGAYGFGVGDKMKKGDAGYIPSKGAWTAKTMEDAKQMAVDFAEGVS